MIKTIIFDCYGVLVQDSWLPFKQRHFANDERLLAAANELSWQLDSGIITFSDFTHGVAEYAGIDYADTMAQLRINPRNNELFDYISQSLKSKYSIGLLSNAGENWLDTLFSPEQNLLFDEVVLSCDIGHVKPDPVAYETIVDRLDVEPHQAVFIDDQPKYIIGASEFGLHTVHYKSNQQTIAELEHLLNTHK